MWHPRTVDRKALTPALGWHVPVRLLYLGDSL